MHNFVIIPWYSFLIVIRPAFNGVLLFNEINEFSCNFVWYKERVEVVIYLLVGSKLQVLVNTLLFSIVYFFFFMQDLPKLISIHPR